MSDPADIRSHAPYRQQGPSMRARVLWVMASLSLLALLYGGMYDWSFVPRWGLCVAAGLALEAAYLALGEGRWALRSGSSAITAAILIMSVPARFPLLPLLLALFVGVFVARMGMAGTAIRFNPALVARLFLMLAYNHEVVAWTRPGLPTDGVTTATPLDLFHAEGATYGLGALLQGRIGGNWEGLYEIVAGSPGELFTPAILLIGVILALSRVMEWRVGVAFLAAFAATCAVVGLPVVFSLLTGSVLFAAVFIAGDPVSTPASKGGRLMAGIVAGVANALIRAYTFYSEGIVFAFLLANLLAPALDRLAFNVRGLMLLRQVAAFDRPRGPRSGS